MRLTASIPVERIQSKGDLIVRAFWLALAAIHVGPLLRVGSAMLGGELEGARWISMVALLLSLVFFGFKTAGVRFLRMRCGWRGLILFVVACGFLHGNATPGAWLEKTGYTAAAVAVAGGAMELTSRRMRRRVSELLTRLRAAALAALALLRPPVAFLDDASAVFWRHLLATSHGPPRAPPVLSSYPSLC